MSLFDDVKNFLEYKEVNIRENAKNDTRYETRANILTMFNTDTVYKDNELMLVAEAWFRRTHKGELRKGETK